ncbi:MAG TPA: sigma-70 family RNA polymerase sigma factor [Blastocatellia bacterium]|nr:sigma-70 family RNA polymerase sigma factor [Blastocatellia bacterium]
MVRRYSPRVFQVAGRFFRQRAQVEEAAQEAFLRAYTQLSSFEGKGSFEGWLTRLTTNLCLNMVRSAKRRPESTAADLSEDESDWLENRLADVSTARHESSERGRAAADLAEKVLNDMSPDDRLVLMMIDGEENSVKEVSEMTGWSESKVKTQAFRARRRMREAVESLLGGRRKTEP